MYRNETGDVIGNRVLLIPMVGSQRRSYGLLEIRGVNTEATNHLDVQYFGLIVSKISKIIF